MHNLINLVVTTLLSCAVNLVTADESVLAVYIFSRHGDRTAKSTPPVNLTDLGYQEIYTSGQYFRDRYISSDASYKIRDISSDLVDQSQITVSAPVDTVLRNSAQAFLQGLYPPIGPSTSTLRNGTEIQVPMDGYQLIPVNQVSHGQSSEDAAWLQGQSNCPLAEMSGQNFYDSAEFDSLLESTQPFYDRIAPMVKHIFGPSQMSYEKAYLIYDALHVASIHNSTFPSSDLLTPSNLDRLRALAHLHEYDLAYNASDRVRAITGAITAADVVTSLSDAVENPTSSPKLHVQFGAYAGMLSFFGLAGLPDTSPDFFGIPDYASTLTWELVLATSTDQVHDKAGNVVEKYHPRSVPEEELYVRFLFHNGTASNNISEPAVYPLFGQEKTLLAWPEFVAGMNAFAISAGSPAWCEACGNTTGICGSSLNSNSSEGDGSGDQRDGQPVMSTTEAAIMGALVSLAVVLVIELLVALAAGLRLVSKKRLAACHCSAEAAPSVSSSPAPSFVKV